MGDSRTQSIIMAKFQALLSLTAALYVTLLSSSFTPFSITAILPSLAQFPDIELHSTNASESHSISHQSDVILDYSYSTGISARLLETTEATVICMHTFCPPQERMGRWGAKAASEALTSYLRALNITELFLAVTAVPFYQNLAHFLTQKSELRFTSVTYLSPGISLNDTEAFVGRILKPSGSLRAALLVEEATGARIFPLLQTYHILDEDYVYIVSDETAWGIQCNGVLYLTDSAAVTARSRVEYEGFILLDELNHLVTSNLREIEVSLVTIENNVPVVVARRPGLPVEVGRDVASPMRRPIIEVSGDQTSINYDGSFFPFAYLYLPGLYLGYSEVNRRNNIVPNYQFVNNSLSLGAALWNEDWGRSQLTKYRDKVGIAYHHFAFSEALYGMLPLMEKMNIIVPVTTLCNAISLSDPVKYPMVFRTSASSATSALVMLRFFRLFGWTKCAVIYSDVGGDVDFYDSFLEYSKMQGVTIINSDKNRMVPIFQGGSEFDAGMNRTIEEIMKNTVRVIVMSHVTSYSIIARMYDYGARRGDYVICMAYDILKGQTEEEDFKIRNIVHGSLIFFEKYFMGGEGPLVKKAMMDLEGSNFVEVTCLLFDHAMLIAHAVGFMLARGQHFEDGVELAKTIRFIRFNGCLGVIKIEAGTNDKRAGDFSVINVQVSEDFSTLSLIEGGVYSPTKIQLFTLQPDLQFPDGSHDFFPDSWLMSGKCPYLLKDIRDFPEGVGVSLGINGWFVGVTSLSAVLTWRAWRHHPFPLLTEAVSLSWDDSLSFFRLVIEFLQLSALGPDLGDLILTKLQNLSVFRLEMFVALNHNVYWTLAIVIYCWTAVLLIQCCIRFLNVLTRLKSTDCCNNWVLTLVFPFLNGVLYVPVGVTMLDVFQCEETNGGWQGSYLNRDCHEHCWVGEHLLFSIVSLILLHLFLPVFTATALHWQNDRSQLHLLINPLYMCLKYSISLLFVSLCVTLKTSHPLPHAVIYLVLTCVYVCVVLLVRPYNYERVNLWTRLLTLALCFYGVFGLIRVAVPGFSSEICLIILGAIYAVLGIFGFLVQIFVKKFRSLLTQEKEDRYDIIKFAFTFGILAQTHLQHFKEKIARTRYSQAINTSEHQES